MFGAGIASGMLGIGSGGKIRIYEILQDILWAAWTMAKEAQGEDFGSYGRDRLKRGKQAYEKLY